MSTATPWIDARRSKAAEHFRALGVPHRRIEEWKYTDLKTVLDGANDDGSVVWKVGKSDAVELFDFSDAVNAPEWVKAHFGALPQNAMASSSLAHARTGFALRVSANDVSEIVSVGFGDAGSARGLIVLEDGASLTLRETVNTEGYANIGVEIVIGTNAQLTHIRTAPYSAGAIQVEEYAIKVARDGVYRAHFFNGGAKLSRAELQISLAGENAQAHLSGVSVIGSNAHADITTHVTHAVGHTASTQLFKHVAGGKSRVVYQGKISVAQGADKSDSRQTAKALLLGERAEADLKPELEIFADDVKCAHGAAVGDLDADSLFYLRARGIPEAEARNMLLRAFLEEAVAEIVDEAIRTDVWKSVEDALLGAMAS